MQENGDRWLTERRLNMNATQKIMFENWLSKIHDRYISCFQTMEAQRFYDRIL